MKQARWTIERTRRRGRGKEIITNSPRSAKVFLLKSILLMALFSALALQLWLSSYRMGVMDRMGIDVVVVEKDVLDGMVELRSAVNRLSEQVFDVHGEYGYIPLPGRFKALTELLEGKIVPYYLSTPLAM